MWVQTHNRINGRKCSKSKKWGSKPTTSKYLKIEKRLFAIIHFLFGQELGNALVTHRDGVDVRGRLQDIRAQETRAGSGFGLIQNAQQRLGAGAIASDDQLEGFGGDWIDQHRALRALQIDLHRLWRKRDVLDELDVFDEGGHAWECQVLVGQEWLVGGRIDRDVLDGEGTYSWELAVELIKLTYLCSHWRTSARHSHNYSRNNSS